MNTKLTLVMEDEVIYKAKSYAQKKGTSLSSLIENYLKTVANDEKPNKDANLL
jgi:predicted HicB family RNase H-like nuclease